MVTATINSSRIDSPLDKISAVQEQLPLVPHPWEREVSSVRKSTTIGPQAFLAYEPTARPLGSGRF